MLHKKDRAASDLADKDENLDEAKTSQDTAADETDEQGAEQSEPRQLSRTAIESRRHAGVAALVVILMIASMVALLLPAWSIPAGCDLGGANVVTLTASDLGDTSIDDVLTQLKTRADALEEHDIQLSKAGDDSIELRVPKGYDAESVADALTRVGHLEIARLDSVSDADALQKIQAGADNVTLEPGTYEAFATSDNVRDASVTAQSYYGMTYYAVTLTLDADGTSALADVTGDLADGSGQVVVLVDGVVVATPSVSSKIENGKMNVAGGFTESQAYAYAAAFKSGELPCGLSQTEPAEVAPRAGGEFVYVAWAAALLLAAIACAIAIRKFGRAGRVAFELPVLSTIISLGILTILARFDLVVLGRAELIGIGAMELAGVIVAFNLARSYAQGRSKGLSVRKSCQQAEQLVLRRSLVAALAVLVVFVVLAILSPGFNRELDCAVCCGSAAILVTYGLYASASLAIATAADAEVPASDSADAASEAGE